MINSFNYSLKSKKAVALYNGSINNFVNLIFCENSDNKGENNTEEQVFNSDFILNISNMSILKNISSVLYNKFSKVSINY